MREIIASIVAEYHKYKLLGEASIAQLSETELSQQIAAGSNTVTSLVWHLCGNLKSRFTDFLTTDGEKPWRDKHSEFLGRSVTRSELQAKWDEGWSTLFQALEALTDRHLTESFITIRGQRLRVDQAMLRSLTHAGYHVGQIVFLTKAIRGSEWKGLKA
jgi:uncharacterized damage-inducible protein DinB